MDNNTFSPFEWKSTQGKHIWWLENLVYLLIGYECKQRQYMQIPLMWDH